MKLRIILILTTLLLFSSSQQRSGVTITGEIQNHDQTPLVIHDFLGKSTWKTYAEVQDGLFEIKLPIDKPVIKGIGYGSSRKDLFLEPGKTLEISFDAADMNSTLRFEGSLATENSILDSLSTQVNAIDYRYIYSRPLDVAAAYLDSLTDASKQYLGQLSGDKPTSPLFTEYADAFIEYNTASIKIMLGERQDEQPEGYYDFLNQLTLENENYIDIPQYRMFLYQYVEMEANKRLHALDTVEKESPDALFEEKLSAIEDLENENIRSYARFNAVNFYLMEHGINEFEKPYTYFRNTNQDPFYDEQMRMAYEVKQQIAPGQPAPQFTLPDVDGNPVSLSDFEGKYVLLDFWATLCPRSARELPHYLDLYTAYGKENIAFVSISNDPDSKSWSDYVREKKNVGASLRAENGWDADVFRDYQVFGLPTFVLIDTEGNIIDPLAAKPSTPEIRETLDQLLMD